MNNKPTFERMAEEEELVDLLKSCWSKTSLSQVKHNYPLQRKTEKTPPTLMPQLEMPRKPFAPHPSYGIRQFLLCLEESESSEDEFDDTESFYEKKITSKRLPGAQKTRPYPGLLIEYIFMVAHCPDYPITEVNEDELQESGACAQPQTKLCLQEIIRTIRDEGESFSEVARNISLGTSEIFRSKTKSELAEGQVLLGIIPNCVLDNPVDDDWDSIAEFACLVDTIERKKCSIKSFVEAEHELVILKKRLTSAKQLRDPKGIDLWHQTLSYTKLCFYKNWLYLYLSGCDTDL